jgi:glycosyltransferase involved in cell wall biosynthesis
MVILLTLKIQILKNNILISIIMPAYNAEKYINEAIQSVINQTHKLWELIIIDDGSTDNTVDILNIIIDSRIVIINQAHKGVGASRNVGLRIMKGQYFCFLDSDDIFTPMSLSSRLEVFIKNNEISFVDGAVNEIYWLQKRFIRRYVPKLRGYPLNNLLKLNDKCFVGNSWMIKRDFNYDYKFDEKMTHCEDLYFYISISEGKKYDYTNNLILIYRKRFNSAMSDYLGLEKGYRKLYKNINREFNLKIVKKLIIKYKIIKVMALIFVKNRHDFKLAFKSIYYYLLM